MTLTEAYEAIRDYFTQPDAVLAKTYSDRGFESCDYRNEAGQKCAIGCLIPDDLYNKSIEGLSGGEALFTLSEMNPVGYLATFGDPHDDVLIAFLEEAQGAHDDRADTAAEFVVLLDQIAEEYGLAVL